MFLMNLLKSNRYTAMYCVTIIVCICHKSSCFILKDIPEDTYITKLHPSTLKHHLFVLTLNLFVDTINTITNIYHMPHKLK